MCIYRRSLVSILCQERSSNLGQKFMEISGSKLGARSKKLIDFGNIDRDDLPKLVFDIPSTSNFYSNSSRSRSL